MKQPDQVVRLACDKCGSESPAVKIKSMKKKHATPARLAMDAIRPLGWRRRYKPRVMLLCPACVGTPNPGRVGRPPAFDPQQAAKLLGRGKSLAEVAERYGVSRQAVQQGVKRWRGRDPE